MDCISWDDEDSPKSLNWNEPNTLDQYHSHFLLLDDGRMNNYLDDSPRSEIVNAICSKRCHSITIIIEGGFNTVQVIRKDLDNERPIVIIHGSGRLSNVLGTLLDLSSKKDTLEYETNNFPMKFLSFPLEILTCNSKLNYFFLNASENMRKSLCQKSLKILKNCSSRKIVNI